MERRNAPLSRWTSPKLETIPQSLTRRPCRALLPKKSSESRFATSRSLSVIEVGSTNASPVDGRRMARERRRVNPSVEG